MKGLTGVHLTLLFLKEVILYDDKKLPSFSFKAITTQELDSLLEKSYSIYVSKVMWNE